MKNFDCVTILGEKLIKINKRRRIKETCADDQLALCNMKNFSW